jgi:hypothetical protein
MPELAISVVVSANTRGKNSESEIRVRSIRYVRLQQNLRFATRLKPCDLANRTPGLSQNETVRADSGASSPLRTKSAD